MSQSIISSSLSSKYRDLDVETAIKLTPFRVRLSKWPELESALFQWHQSVDQSGGIVSTEMLKEKAISIWKQLPQHHVEREPSFSNGWLVSFRRRYQIKPPPRHAEAGSIPAIVSEPIQEEVQSAQAPSPSQEMIEQYSIQDAIKAISVIQRYMIQTMGGGITEAPTWLQFFEKYERLLLNLQIQQNKTAPSSNQVVGSTLIAPASDAQYQFI